MGVLGKYEAQPVGALGKIMTHKHLVLKQLATYMRVMLAMVRTSA